MKHSKQFMLALAIMLIALLVPSFAMADGTTFTFSKASYDIDFTRGLYSVNVNSPWSASEITITNTFTEDHSVEWSSNDESIVRVDGGYSYLDSIYDEENDEWVDVYKFYTYLYPQKVGTAIISAKENGQLLGQFTVNFKEVPVTEIAFREAEGETDYRVEKNDTIPVGGYLTVKPDNSTYGPYDYPVKWSVDDSSIARVSKDGFLKGLKAGTVKVTATPTDTNVKAVTHEFTVVEQNAPITKLTFSAESLSLATNDYSLYLNEYLTVEPTDYVDSLIWTSSDASIAEVTDEGGIRPSKPGEVTIKVRSKKAPKVTASMKLNITKEPLKSIAFTEPALTLTDNGINLRKYITTDPAYYADSLDEFFFTVSDEEVARIDTDEGYFVWPSDSRIAGTATITAAYREDDSVKAELTVTVKPVAYTSVAFKDKDLTIDLKNSYSKKAYFTVKPYNATNKALLSFESNDTEVADIEEYNLNDGYVVIRGYKPGEATISIRNTETDKVEAELKVTVKDNPVTAAKFVKDAYTVKVGRRIDPVVKCTPSNARYDSYYLESSDEEIVFIDEDGEIYGRKAGDATITATFVNRDGSVVTASTKVTVTDIPVTAAKFAKEAYSVKVNKGVKTNVKFTPVNGNYEDIIYESSDEEIATVDNDGYVYGVKAGEVTITATVVKADGTTLSATTKVTVTDTKLEKAAFKKAEYTVKSKKEVTAYFATTPSNATFDTDDYYVEVADNEIANAQFNDSKSVNISGKEPGETTVSIKNKETDAVVCSAKVIVKGVAATKVTVKKNAIKLYYTDKNANNYVIQPTVSPRNATVKAINYETTDSGVAYVEPIEVNQQTGEPSSYYGYGCGRIIATGVGKCTVKVIVETVDNKTVETEINVTVVSKTIKLGLSETKKTIYLQKDAEVEPFKLEAFNAETDDLVDVKWSSSKKTIAKVDRSGIVTPVKAGTAKITATTKDGNKTKATCTITVKKQKVTKVTLKKTKLSMKVGDTAQLTWTVKPSYAYDKAVKVKSSNSKVVKVDADGNLTALTKGKATITVTAADGSKKKVTCKVTVK